MYTILETTTNRVLFAKYDNIVLENQIAIKQVCELENPDNKDFFYDFETQQFYLQNEILNTYNTNTI